MLTLVVTVPLPAGLQRDEWLVGAQAIASRFRDVPGLLRKNFIFNRELGLGGGVYTWATREQAESFHAKDGPWHRSLLERFGAEPSIQIFDSPVIVDNELGRVDVAA